jgi:MoaA/NifB/PqqE/SkfB family radical SAM enzyme
MSGYYSFHIDIYFAFAALNSIMKFYSHIKEIDIEHSSMCNAACPGCTREIIPGNHKWFRQTYLPEEIYSKKIPDSVFQNLETVFFSGMVGDPCVAPNFIDVCKIIQHRAPHVNIRMSTNGGMRNPEWWAKLGATLKKGSLVRFAIDGLEDTNHIYRVNVKWKKVLENFRAFIDAGGEAEWQWIAFKHNEHQIEEAKHFARQEGFSRFIIRKSHKFLLDSLFELENVNKQGMQIEQPMDKDLIHPLILEKEKQFTIQDALKVSDKSCVSCGAQENGMAYISAEGYVFPCVFTGTCFHIFKNKDIGDGWKYLWENYGGDNINLLKQDWSKIVEGSFFDEVQNGWMKSYKQGKLAACGLICSKSSARIFDLSIDHDVKTEFK